MEVAPYGTMGKVSNPGVAYMVRHHNYYCRSLTGIKIIGEGPNYMPEDREICLV